MLTPGLPFEASDYEWSNCAVLVANQGIRVTPSNNQTLLRHVQPDSVHLSATFRSPLLQSVEATKTYVLALKFTVIVRKTLGIVIGRSQWKDTSGPVSVMYM